MYSTKIYCEVYYVLSKMKKNIVMMIPIEILEHIKKSSYSELRNINRIDIENIEYDSAKILVWLFYNFIANNYEKQQIDNLMENSKRNKFNPENIFHEKNTVFKEESKKVSNQLIEYKNSKLRDIFNKILSFLGLK